MTEPRIISNSEANTWLACRRKYYFAHVLNLTPIDSRKGKALRTGIYGHDNLETYFGVLKDQPGNFEQAKEIALQQLLFKMSKTQESSDLPIYRLLIQRLKQYYEYFPRIHPNAQILEIETKHTLPLTDEFSYGMKLDMYWTDPPFYYITDHKFTHNFWPQTKVDTGGSGQTSKYFLTLKHEGYEVDEAMLNQIRYRERQKPPYTDEELFKETTWKPTREEMNNIFKEQMATSREIVNFRTLPEDLQERTATRSLGSNACEFCEFSAICVASLRGHDISADIEQNFQQNKTYGYNPVDVTEAM